MHITFQDEVLVGKDHPIVLSVNAPKEVSNCKLLPLQLLTVYTTIQIEDVEGACQGILGLEEHT